MQELRSSLIDCNQSSEPVSDLQLYSYKNTCKYIRHLWNSLYKSCIGKCKVIHTVIYPVVDVIYVRSGLPVMKDERSKRNCPTLNILDNGQDFIWPKIKNFPPLFTVRGVRLQIRNIESWIQLSHTILQSLPALFQSKLNLYTSQKAVFPPKIMGVINGHGIGWGG